MAELTREPGVATTDWMKGTWVMVIVRPPVRTSMMLPAEVIVCMVKVSVVLRVNGFIIPGMLNT